MGDGRYYTSEQFFSIIYLTTLIIFMTVSIMLSVYKGSKNKISKQVLMPMIVLFIIVVFSFIEQVVVSQQQAFFIRCCMGVMFIGVNFLFVRFNLNVVSNLLTKSNYSYKLKYVLYILMGSFLVISYFRSELLIQEYSFNYIKYGLVYILANITVLLYYFYFVLLIATNKNINGTFSKRVFLLCICIFWILPMLIYIWAIIMNIPNIKIIEFAIYSFMSICLNIISGLFTPYRVSSSIFSDVRNIMLDYVFIIGEKGEVIYKNSRVEKAGIFKDIESIDVQDIHPVFNKDIIIRDAYNRQFIHYLGKNSIYFAYRKKPLKEAEKIAGYIITLTDITDLINMLDELKEKQESTVKANNKLSHYKDIVYDIEKEKEIYNLLDEIANNQQKSMIKLKCDIDNLNGNTEDFMEKIAEIIAVAKFNLQDVRNAVTTYMDYYGGEND